MIKAVFDTNVYISALLFGGIPQKLIDLAFEGIFKLYISEEILNEISSVLGKKFHYSSFRIKQATNSIKQLSMLVNPTKTINLVKNWPPDNRILECCQEAKANYLVSGDKKHLLPLKKFKSTQIITPSQFLNVYLNPIINY